MPSSEPACANGSCGKPGKHLCSGCNEELYCSKDCQKSHWLMHKQSCQSATKAVSGLSFNALSAKQLKNLLKAKAAGFDKELKKSVLDLLEKTVEKPELVSLVAEHVKLSEIETLLSSTDSANGKPNGSSSSSSSSSSSANRSQSVKKSKETSSRSSSQTNHPVPTPDQMRQQAAAIRKDPQSIRRANPAFEKWSDEQMRAYADQMEKTAADPKLMKEMERMARMTPKEKEQLQSIQDGLQGVKPMDDAWLDDAIGTLKSNPGFYKSLVKGKGAMFGGVTDEQIESFVDTAAMMDAGTLKWIFKAIKYLGSWAKPLSEMYQFLDKKTYGFAKHILLGLLAIIVYNVVLMWIAVGRFLLSYFLGWKSVAPVATAAGDALSPAAKVLAESGSASALAGVVQEAAPVAAAAALAAKVIPADINNAKQSKKGKDLKEEAVDMEFSF